MRRDLWPFLWILVAISSISGGCDKAASPNATPMKQSAPAQESTLPVGPISEGSSSRSMAMQSPRANQPPGPPSQSELSKTELAKTELAKSKGSDIAVAREDAAAETPAFTASDGSSGDLPDDSDPYLPRRKLPPLELVDVPVAKLSDFGLQTSASKHLLLITDLPTAEIPNEFHEVFTQAVPQWVDFFGADSRRFADWKITCFLIVDEAKFAQAKLLPGVGQLPQGKLPPGGWQYGNQIWVRHQPGPYYTRHMLLHEATHAFSAYNFGALGAPWLAEGLAEYFAVHRWADGQLQLAARVTDKDQLPYWGRVKLVRDAYQSGVPKSLLEVMKFPPNAFPNVDSYAWSWVAVSLYAHHPQLREPFLAQVRQLGQKSDTQWNRDLLQAIPMSRAQLEAQWQVDTTTLQYGHDFARTAVQWQDSKVSDQAQYQLTLPADGAWHSTGLRLATGQWEINADGSYEVTQSEAGAWVSQPEGITIRYVLGAPIGQVQFALQGDPAILQGMSELTKPRAVGRQTVVSTTGEELFLRVNDWPNQLDDNQGQVAISLRRL